MIILDYPSEYMLNEIGVENALGWAKRLLKPKSKIRRKCMVELARLCGTVCTRLGFQLHLDILVHRVYGLMDRTALFK